MAQTRRAFEPDTDSLELISELLQQAKQLIALLEHAHEANYMNGQRKGHATEAMSECPECIPELHAQVSFIARQEMLLAEAAVPQ